MRLVEFLLARIAEDEAVARACVGPEWENGLPATIHPNPETYRTVIRRVGHVCGSIIAADAEHIARHDPARVLAECAAKRQLIRWVQQWPMRPYPPSSVDGVLEILALPYAEHPDYAALNVSA